MIHHTLDWLWVCVCVFPLAIYALILMLCMKVFEHRSLDVKISLFRVAYSVFQFLWHSKEVKVAGLMYPGIQMSS